MGGGGGSTSLGLEVSGDVITVVSFGFGRMVLSWSMILSCGDSKFTGSGEDFKDSL